MSSSSSEDDDDNASRELFVSVTPVGQPYSRYQGSYLFNLQKLLNDAAALKITFAVRWHSKISNALEINWHRVSTDFSTVHEVLVNYKLSRGSNRYACVRPTMNRKLREWNFYMVVSSGHWVTYIYESALFGRSAVYGMLPTHRRCIHT